MKKDDLYILLKPEVRNHVDYLENFLRQEKFYLKSIYSIKDWENLSLDLYRPQMEVNPVFSRGVHAYLWLSKQLFGNSSVIFLLKENGVNLQRKLNRLDKTKKKFRESLSKEWGDALKIFLNMEKVNTLGSDELGIVGKLQIGDYVFQDPKMEGRWEDFYFKYIHAPDPNPNNHYREMNILERQGVFDSSIDSNKWRLMKKLGTFTLP